MATLLQFRKVLPRALNRRLILSQLRFDEAALADVRVRSALTEEELLGAAKLVYESYKDVSLIVPHPSSVHVCRHSASPNARVFVATREDRMVGTISVLLDSDDDGLNIDKTFAEETCALRAKGRIAEVGALAIIPELRHSGLVLWLNRIMGWTAWNLGIDILTMCVRESAVDLYETAMLFRPVGRARPHGTNHRMLVPLALDLRTWEADLRAHFGHMKPCAANAHWVYYGPQPPQIELGLVPPPPASRPARRALRDARPDAVDSRRSLLDEGSLLNGTDGE